MPIIEDFELPAGDHATVNFDVAGNPGDTLLAATIRWRVFNQRFGVPYGDAIIEKSTESADDIEITDEDALTFAVTIIPQDTQDLLGRYWHEAEVTFADGTVATVTQGILTITRGEIPNL